MLENMLKQTKTPSIDTSTGFSAVDWQGLRQPEGHTAKVQPRFHAEESQRADMRDRIDKSPNVLSAFGVTR